MFKPPIAKEIREHILARIKNDGVSVAQAARDHGVSSKTIYGWLNRGVMAQPGILELNRVKRENEGLYQLIGRLTHEINKLKKNGGRSYGW